MTQPESFISVSHSEAETFVRCSRQHYYGYGLKIQPKGGSMSHAVYRGILAHEGLQVYFRALRDKDPNPLGKMLAYIGTHGHVDTKYDGKIHGEVITLLSNWAEYRGAEVAEWQIIKVEEETAYTIHDGLKTVILPDVVARIPGRGYTVVDHKVVFDFTSLVLVEILPQLPKYMMGLRKEGINIQSAILNEFRYRDLKDLDPEVRFKFTNVPVSQHRLIQTMKEHTIIGSRIEKLKSGTLEQWEYQTLRAANKQVCGMCSFKDLCAADMRGEDTTLMKSENYQSKRRREKMMTDE